MDGYVKNSMLLLGNFSAAISLTNLAKSDLSTAAVSFALVLVVHSVAVGTSVTTTTFSPSFRPIFTLSMLTTPFTSFSFSIIQVTSFSDSQVPSTSSVQKAYKI